MGACAYGAIKIVGKPSYIRPSDADMLRWFGTFYYQWWGPLTVFMGEVYDVDQIVLSNPDIPPSPSEIQLTSSLMGDMGAIYDLRAACDKWIRYNIFQENSQCLPAAGPCPAYSGTWLNTVPDWSVPGWMNVGSQINSLHWEWTVLSNSGYTGTWRTRIFYGSPTGVILATHQSADHSGWPTSGVVDDLVTVPGATQFQCQITTSPWSSGGNMRANITYAMVPTCAEGSPTPVPTLTPISIPNVPPYVVKTGCTTDDVCRLVQMALNKLDALYDPINATQRQSVPFGYVAGVVHAGLTGSGQIAVAGLLGLAVNFTTVPGRLPVDAGTPDQIWQLGRISLGTADGWQRNITLTHNPALVVPVSAFVTKVGYTLPVGVTATITELKAEP